MTCADGITVCWTAKQRLKIFKSQASSEHQMNAGFLVVSLTGWAFYIAENN